jgi:DHA1 family bicyclomycin/chloramphenicol resistance-like MFS transporter
MTAPSEPPRTGKAHAVRDGAGGGEQDRLRSAMTISFVEFIALMALLTAMSALSIDIMLPSLPEIGRHFGVGTENDRQMVVTSYLLGIAVGQLFYGPLSDKWGRKTLLLAGLSVYLVGSIAALWAEAFWQLLAARLTQGFGAAAARVIAVAIVRDLFAGRQMARIMSLVMTVFIIVPVFAPSIGQGLTRIGSWTWSFHFLLLIGVLAILWSQTRLGETRWLGSEGKQIGLARAFATVLGTRQTVGYATAAGFVFGCLVSYISSAQQVFVEVFGLGDKFPLAFGSVALAMAAASFANAMLVQRLGMRRAGHAALLGFCAVSLALALSTIGGRPPVLLFIVLLGCAFFCFGLISSNFNAIAMQPLGQIAGTASSFTGFYTSVLSALIGFTVGRLFDGTARPLAFGFCLLGGLALLTVLATEGRRGLFRGD